MLHKPTLRQRLALARSVTVYYGNPIKLRRMRRLYAQFMQPGDLCFDVGAHVGNRLFIWRTLGARVVAIEPQPVCMALLQRWFGRDRKVTLLAQAVGAQPAQAQLWLSSATPSVTTLSQPWMDAVQQSESFAKVKWDHTLPVTVTTLDALIAQHGEPVFCKIDVEGYEQEVLAGLSTPLRALSFEYIGAARALALACMQRLAQLGEYQFNWSQGEQQRLRSATWLPHNTMYNFLAQLQPDSGSGDIYAKLARQDR